MENRVVARQPSLGGVCADPLPSRARAPAAGPRACGGSMSVARWNPGPSAASKYPFLGGRGERTGRDPSDTRGCEFLIVRRVQ